METKPISQKGFSLLEVLVAFSVLALCLGVLLRIFGGDARLAGMAGEHSRAVVVAESLLANVGVETPLAPGQYVGTIDDTFDWVLQVIPFVPNGEPLPDNMSFKPYWVEVTVEWGDDDRPKTFSLATLRLVGQNQQPGLTPRL